MQQRSFGRMGTAIWSSGEVMGVRKHSFTVGAYSWPGDDWSTILCGGKGVFAQPPHSAHKWAPFDVLFLFFYYLGNTITSIFNWWCCRKICDVFIISLMGQTQMVWLYNQENEYLIYKMCVTSDNHLIDMFDSVSNKIWQKTSALTAVSRKIYMTASQRLKIRL